MPPSEAHRTATGSDLARTSSSCCRINLVKMPRRRWLGSTPTAVTPAAAIFPPGTVRSASNRRDHRPICSSVTSKPNGISAVLMNSSNSSGLDGLNITSIAGDTKWRASQRSARFTGWIAPMSEFIVPPGARDRVETLTARRRDVWVVAGFLAAVALGGLVLWSRGGAAAVAPPAVPPQSEGAEVAASPTGEPEQLYVHVAGAVRRSGLYELPPGARVADAIDAARGTRAKADLDLINLAEPVADGMQVFVPRRGESGAPAAPSASATPGDGPALVDINTADQLALETIPGIGPVKAAAILEYRESVGRFDSVEELLDVTGIGPATLESMRAYVTAG